MRSRHLLLALTAFTIVYGSTPPGHAELYSCQRPDGSIVYTDDQARRGQRVYEQGCAQCHLADLMGDGIAPALVGRSFFFRWSDLSVADMIVAIRTTMPEGAPASLSAAGYVDISAYLLEKNTVPSGDAELPTDLDDLGDITITEEAQ